MSNKNIKIIKFLKIFIYFIFANEISLAPQASLGTRFYRQLKNKKKKKNAMNTLKRSFHCHISFESLDTDDPETPF